MERIWEVLERNGKSCEKKKKLKEINIYRVKIRKKNLNRDYNSNKIATCNGKIDTDKNLQWLVT